MAELSVNQLIKIILGILVVVAVLAGLYIGFKERFFDFFKTVSIGEEPLNLVRSLFR